MTRDIITLTPAAAEYIRAGTEGEGGLRVSLRKGGCSGHEYVFDYVASPAARDEVVKATGVQVFVDPGAVLYVIGSELDYVEDDFSAKLVFRNPNEKGSCGCGKSVSFS